MRSLLVVTVVLSLAVTARAQSGSRYDFYRHPESQAITVNPLGFLLGRIDGHFEQRLDPNFTRTYGFAYQPDIRKNRDSGTVQTAYTADATERIYLIDNAAMLGQFVGLGAGIGAVGKSFGLRLTAELGYKLVLGSASGKFFIEPVLTLDSYLIGNGSIRRVLPYIALPFGYCW
jgi:hypothetical protein